MSRPMSEYASVHTFYVKAVGNGNIVLLKDGSGRYLASVRNEGFFLDFTEGDLGFWYSNDSHKGLLAISHDNRVVYDDF